MNRLWTKIFFLELGIFFLLVIPGKACLNPCYPSAITTYFAADTLVPGDWRGQSGGIDCAGSIVTTLCDRFQGPWSSATNYLYQVDHIKPCGGYDIDTMHIVFGCCYDAVTDFMVWDNIRIIVDDKSITTCGVYIITAHWDDVGEPDYASDGEQKKDLILKFWEPNTTYYTVGPPVQPGDIKQGGTTVNGQTFCVPWSGPDSITNYMSGLGLSLTPGSDIDIFNNYYKNGDCIMILDTTGVPDSVSSQWTTYNVGSPGTYPVQAIWNDSPLADDPAVTKSISLKIWIPETTVISYPPILPGHIYQDGYVMDSQTFYEGLHSDSYNVCQWLSDHHISVSDGSDQDTRIIVTYNSNCQTSASTTLIDNCMTTYRNFDCFTLNSPGEYTLSWTFADKPCPPNCGPDSWADDADVIQFIKLVVFKVDISQPSSWPFPLVSLNSQTCVATVTPSAALGGAFSWSQDSGDGSGSFSPNNTSSSTTVFTAGLNGYVYTHVSYTIGGASASSDEKTFIVFTMSIAGVSFVEDNPMYFDGDHDGWGVGGQIPDVVWTPSTTYPICYNKNHQLKMTATFALSTILPVSASVYVEADGMGSYNTCTVSGSVSGSTSSISGFISSTTLQNSVGIQSFNYYWEYTSNKSRWIVTGPSGSHKVYITYGTPSPSGDLTEKRINRCIVSHANGLNDPLAIADSLYPVEGAEFNGATGVAACNFAQGTTPISTNWYMFSPDSTNWDIKGSCVAYATLNKMLLDLLGVSGGSVVYIYPSSDCNGLEGSSWGQNESTTFNCLGTDYNAYLIYCSGGPNNYEGTLKFVANSTTKYYSGGNFGSGYSPLEILNRVVEFQYWVWTQQSIPCSTTKCDTDTMAVNTADVPLPQNCP